LYILHLFSLINWQTIFCQFFTNRFSKGSSSDEMLENIKLTITIIDFIIFYIIIFYTNTFFNINTLLKNDFVVLNAIETFLKRIPS